jgi:hypothetical protein
MNRTLTQHIEEVREELSRTDVNAQRRRYLEDFLTSLEAYQARHPGKEHDPSSLELFCDENPESNECRIFDV